MLRGITASSLDSEMPGSLSVARRQSNDGLRPPRDYRNPSILLRNFLCSLRS